MIIEVKVKTSCKASSVKKVGDIYTVCLKSRPQKNLANNELINVLASHFNISKSYVNIVHGFKGRKKIIEIETE